MRLTKVEHHSIARHLRVAAEEYEEDAKTMRDQKSVPGVSHEALESVAKSFDSQAVEAREFAERFEDELPED